MNTEGYQPARFRPYHSPAKKLDGTVLPIGEVDTEIVYVRPTRRTFSDSHRYELGCNATQFVEVHPDQVLPGYGDLICEHELLTD